MSVLKKQLKKLMKQLRMEFLPLINAHLHNTETFVFNSSVHIVSVPASSLPVFALSWDLPETSDHTQLMTILE